MLEMEKSSVTDIQDNNELNDSNEETNNNSEIIQNIVENMVEMLLDGDITEANETILNLSKDDIDDLMKLAKNSM